MGRNVVPLRVQVRMFLASVEKTQGWLADECDVSEATVSRWLTGRAVPSDDEAERLERVTGIPAQQFLIGA